VQAMYFREGKPETGRFTDGFKAILLVNSLLLVILGIHPDWLLKLFNY
jgi:NADH:ubiquinone oxidoreductase subunit 2 (subunit N)